MTASRRLAELGISLPGATAPLGSYVPARRAGQLLHLSGHLAKRDGAVVAGRVGAEIDVGTARGLARQVALDLVATAAEAAGGVDALAGVVKLVGLVRSAPGFDQQPAVIIIGAPPGVAAHESELSANPRLPGAGRGRCGQLCLSRGIHQRCWRFTGV